MQMEIELYISNQFGTLITKQEYDYKSKVGKHAYKPFGVIHHDVKQVERMFHDKMAAEAVVTLSVVYWLEQQCQLHNVVISVYKGEMSLFHACGRELDDNEYRAVLCAAYRGEKGKVYHCMECERLINRPRQCRHPSSRRTKTKSVRIW